MEPHKLLPFVMLLPHISGNAWESQLYEDLMYNYNKLPRPVQNCTDILVVHFGTALIRIIDIDEKNQVFTTNVWLEMHWFDAKLVWEPEDYNGIKQVHISAASIWTPDIVLYNNAAGDPDIKIYNDAIVHSNGRVVWKPPAIYKSFCEIDVTWFPYDFQNCRMKFGLWTYTGKYVDLQFLPWSNVKHVLSEKSGEYEEHLENGMDRSYFQMSAEWDLLNLTANRHEVIYSSCCGPEKYVDITFTFLMRRKTLFFTCNLILPCFMISCLTTFVFYLSDKKITFAISVLVTLTVFFLILIEIIPPTSVVIPMFGKYLLYTMILLTLSIIISVISVNMHYRTGATHDMPRWMRALFLKYLPTLMCMRSPLTEAVCAEMEPLPNIPSFYETAGTIFEQTKIIGPDGNMKMMESSWPQPNRVKESAMFKCKPSNHRTWSEGHVKCTSHTKPLLPVPLSEEKRKMARAAMKSPDCYRLRLSVENEDELQFRKHRNVILGLQQHVTFISEHFRIAQEQAQHSEEWRFVSKVIDRLFLIVFSFLNLLSLTIILRAPSLSDTTEPLGQTSATAPLSHSRMEL